MLWVDAVEAVFCVLYVVSVVLVEAVLGFWVLLVVVPEVLHVVWVVAVVDVFSVVWLSEVDTVVEPVVSVPVWEISVTSALAVKANTAMDKMVTGM